MENKGLTFTTDGYADYCNIAVKMDCNEVYNTVDVLLDCLSHSEDYLDDDGRFYICHLIRALIPSQEQMKLIFNSQLQGNPHEENKQLAMQVKNLKNENERLVSDIKTIEERNETLNYTINVQNEVIERRDEFVKIMEGRIDILKKLTEAKENLKVLESSIQE